MSNATYGDLWCARNYVALTWLGLVTAAGRVVGGRWLTSERNIFLAALIESCLLSIPRRRQAHVRSQRLIVCG